MDYGKFILKIQEQITRYLPEPYQDAEVSVHKVKKNNDTELMALILQRPGETILPQFYLEQPYEQYLNGTSMEDILERLADSYLQSANVEMPDVADLVSDFDKVQGLLRLQLVNKEYNSEKMLYTPHRDLENTDLTAVLRIHLPTRGDGETTILVSDSLLSNWEKTMDDVYPAALHNTMSAQPARIDSMMNIAMMMSSEESIGYEIEDFQIEPYELYVLRNPSGINGATALLYPDVLEQLAQGANANLFILPSSIHECILIQDTGELDAKELQAMVIPVNQTKVSQEERLSDEVYYYDKEEHSLNMATVREETEEFKAQLSQTIEAETDMRWNVKGRCNSVTRATLYRVGRIDGKQTAGLFLSCGLLSSIP